MAWLSLRKARLWEWHAQDFDPEGIEPFRIAYLGRDGELPIAADLLDLDDGAARRASVSPLDLLDLRPEEALISELPLPASLRVLGHLRTLVSLNRPLAQIVAGYDDHVRSFIRHLAPSSSVRQITDAREICEINREMLIPFARARHRSRAVVGAEADIVRIAQSGYLGVVTLNGEAVAAHLGFSYDRGGRRVWEAARFGYPARVFDDPRRLGEVNTLNAFRALEHAIATGHDVFDFGTSPARPEGGLLQFKRRRGGVLSTFACEPTFWVRLPRDGSASFLWRWPLFSIEREGIVLHLGLPRDRGDDELWKRTKTLTYGGLHALRIHAERPIGGELQRELRARFGSATGAVHGRGSARRVDIVAA